MGRIIKFRAWRTDRKTYTTSGIYFSNTSMEIEFIDGLIVEQFTGLKDKNGQDIYEGDIFYCNNVNYVLKYEILGGAYTVHNIKDDTDERFLHHCNHQIEVIGNIHEKPELL